MVLGAAAEHYHSAYYKELDQNTVLANKNSELIANINEENNQIEIYSKESQQRAENAKAAEAAAALAAAVHERKAQYYLSERVDGNTACDRADNLFNQYIENNTGASK